MTTRQEQLWGRAAWAALGAVHAYFGILHLLALPAGWAFNDIWKGFGAAAGALLMLWWAVRPARGARNR